MKSLRSGVAGSRALTPLLLISKRLVQYVAMPGHGLMQTSGAARTSANVLAVAPFAAHSETERSQDARPYL
jgi:hypothetical protein